MVAGQISLGRPKRPGDSRRQDPGGEGAYRLVVGTELEDLAGNSVAQPFEVDVAGPISSRVTSKTVDATVSDRRPPRADGSSRCQQGESRPAGGRDSLGIADIAGGPGRLDPASVLLLLRRSEMPGPRAIMPRTSGDGSHFASARRASAVSNGSGGELVRGPQPPSSLWPVRRSSRLRRHRPLPAGGTFAPASRHTEASAIVRISWLREPAVGAVDGGAEPVAVGRSQGIACQQCRQRPAIGRRRARSFLALERPRSIGSLVERQRLGGSHQHRPIFDPPGRDGGLEARREHHAGQPLVVKRAVPAVMVPIRRPAQPARSFPRVTPRGTRMPARDAW